MSIKKLNKMGFPEKYGLYDSDNEHENCGFGFIANIKNEPKHEIVHQALEIVHNLDHRGAIGADPLAGDGAGILIQIPHDFFKEELIKDESEDNYILLNHPEALEQIMPGNIMKVDFQGLALEIIERKSKYSLKTKVISPGTVLKNRASANTLEIKIIELKQQLVQGWIRGLKQKLPA